MTNVIIEQLDALPVQFSCLYVTQSVWLTGGQQEKISLKYTTHPIHVHINQSLRNWHEAIRCCYVIKLFMLKYIVKRKYYKCIINLAYSLHDIDTQRYTFHVF